ncbi:MAG: hypothetical protein ACE141_10015 [Bryobacteraceae bacterium]
MRVLRRDKTFTAVAGISLGLSIGANSAIFSLIDAVLVRTLPVHDPERLVVFFNGNSVSHFTWAQFNARSGDWMTGVFATASAVCQDVDPGRGPMRGSADLVTGGLDPIGKTVQVVADRTILEVVGVVRHVRRDARERPAPYVYVPSD